MIDVAMLQVKIKSGLIRFLNQGCSFSFVYLPQS